MIDRFLNITFDWFLSFPKKNYRTKKGFFLISFLIILLFNTVTTKFTNSLYEISLINSIYLSIILVLIWFIIWTEVRDIININTSNKPGIAFFVSSSILTKKDLEKEKFISILKTKLQNEYEILFYDKYEYDIVQRKYENNDDLLNKLNILVKFTIDEENGNCNGINNYIFKLNEAIFRLPKSTSSILSNPTVNNSLQKEMNSLFNRNFCISNDNNLSDSKATTNSIAYSVSYIYTSILCIQTDLNTALYELKKLEDLIDNNSMIDDIKKQLKFNILVKNIFCYQRDLINILDSKIYFKDSDLVSRMLIQNEKVMFLANKGLNIYTKDKKFFELIIEDFKMAKTILLFDLNKKNEALVQIHELDWEKTDNIEISLLNKAFLLIMNQKYDKGFYFYRKAIKKIKRSNEVFDEIFTNISTFINLRLNISSDTSLDICHFVTDYLFYENENTKNELMNFLNKNDDIKNIFYKYFDPISIL